MPDYLPRYLPDLESHRLPGLDAGPGAYYPHYDRRSLANLPASVCHWLGVPGFGIPPLTNEVLESLGGSYRNVILLVVDGLGLEQFEHFMALGSESSGHLSLWPRLLAEGMLFPLTSIIPATTTSALTTLWTGVTPAEHGVIGYEMYLKEYCLTANMITHTPATFAGDVGGLRRSGFQPETFLPCPTLGPHLVAHGVKPVAFQHISIARSGLSTMLFPEVDVIPFRALSDLWVSVPAFLTSHRKEHMYTYIYWGVLDELAHRFGPHDRRVELEFASFSFLFEYFYREFRQQGRGDTLLLMTADHGHLYTPANPKYDLKNHPMLVDCLHMLPSGENRLAYLYLRSGREAEAWEYIENTWPDEFSLIPAEQVIASGLMGSGRIHPRLAERLGDWVMIAQNGAYLWWADKENPLLGRHGGMSRTEMLIPLFGMVI